MRDNSDLHREIAQLRRENEHLSAQLAYRAEERATPHQEQIAAIMARSRFTVGECEVLISLATGRTHTRDMILPFTRAKGEGDNNDRNADSMIKRIRKKLRSNITITTLYGIGYIVEGDSLKALRKFISWEKHDVTLDT